MVAALPDAVYIREPSHLLCRRHPTDFAIWYLAAWRRRIRRASRLREAGKTVIMERSWLSTVAFARARGSKIPVDAANDIHYHRENPPDYIIFLQVTPTFYRRMSPVILKHYSRSGVHLNDPDFRSCYASVLKRLMRYNNIPWCQVDVGDGRGHRPRPIVHVMARAALRDLIQMKPPTF
jgi:hypothetical protein